MCKDIISGVYKITNVANGKIYVGSSKNIKKRWMQHKSSLKNNKHHNPSLQNAFNKYGEDNFVYEVLEYVEENEIIDREQHYIDILNCCDRKVGYNHNPFARGGGFAVGEKNGWFGKGYLQEGESNVFFGKKHSEESKLSMSEKAKQRKGIMNSNFGNRGEKNPLSKPILQVDAKTLEVVKRFGATIEIQRELNFTSSHVCNICIFLKENKVRKKYKGFYWCYEEDLEILLESKEFIRSQIKSVVKLHIETKELLEIFPSVSSAAKSVDMGIESISRACKGKIKHSAGYKWMYLEDYEKKSRLFSRLLFFEKSRG